MNILLTGIPSSGNRWVRYALGIRGKVPWNTTRGRIVNIIKDKSAWGHSPPFPEVLDLPHYKVHIRRKSIPDQICSFAARPRRAIPPDYIQTIEYSDEMDRAIGVMALWYPLQEPWLERADYVLYYEDLCADFEQAITPVVKAVGMDVGAVMTNSIHREGYRLGCPGIGQHKKVWEPRHYELFEELFI